MKKKRIISHYEQKALENKDIPSMWDPCYKDKMIELQQKIRQGIDNARWMDLPWCETFTKQFVKDLSSSKLFVDVGAELGFYTYLALKNMPPDGKIIAFEPDPLRFALLKDFFSEYSNVKVFDFAVYDTEGVKTLVKPRGLSATSAEVEGEEFEVRTVVLDRFLQNEQVDIIKIDIEGGGSSCI